VSVPPGGGCKGHRSGAAEARVRNWRKRQRVEGAPSSHSVRVFPCHHVLCWSTMGTIVETQRARQASEGRHLARSWAQFFTSLLMSSRPLFFLEGAIVDTRAVTCSTQTRSV
jgi:hypothetical protein